MKGRMSTIKDAFWPCQASLDETPARIMHRFSSRSDESDDLTRRATEAPANVLYGTLRRPTECNAVRADDFVDAVENLCIMRARGPMDKLGLSDEFVFK